MQLSSTFIVLPIDSPNDKYVWLRHTTLTYAIKSVILDKKETQGEQHAYDRTNRLHQRGGSEEAQHFTTDGLRVPAKRHHPKGVQGRWSMANRRSGLGRVHRRAKAHSQVTFPKNDFDPLWGAIPISGP